MRCICRNSAGSQVEQGHKVKLKVLTPVNFLTPPSFSVTLPSCHPSLEHRLEGSLDGTSGEISYVFFVFYGSIEATTEAIHRWFYFSKYRQCMITAPVVLTACLRARYTEYTFTRSVYQPPAYASGAPLKH